jgi:hypothetical protein
LNIYFRERSSTLIISILCGNVDLETKALHLLVNGEDVDQAVPVDADHGVINADDLEGVRPNSEKILTKRVNN